MTPDCPVKSCALRAALAQDQCRHAGEAPCQQCVAVAIRRAVSDVLVWNTEHFLEIATRERELGHHDMADAYHNAAYHLQVNGDSVCPS
jgi:hypothetical protein